MMQQKQLTSDMINILIISLILTIIGLLFIYSSSSVFAFEKYGDGSYFLKKQLKGFLLACFAFVVARLAPLSIIKKHAWLFFVGTLLITGLTLIPKFALNIHGSSRWLTIAGFSFQPSELLKIGFILYVASFLSKKESKKKSFVYCYVPLMVIIGTTSLILLKQPDFGLTVTLLLTGAIMMFVAHIPFKYLFGTAIASMPLLIVLIATRAYRLKRILTFLNPWNDPRGSGFQIIQSLIAIGSGGFWGMGIGQSKQKFFYLPMQHTDFIFSIIAEETGFFGSCILLSLFLMFLFFGMRIASRLHDSFSIYACVGFVTLITLEAAINIAVTTGLVPTKGIGMPFISYGNTALVCSFIMIALVMNMVYSQRENAVLQFNF